MPEDINWLEVTTFGESPVFVLIKRIQRKAGIHFLLRNSESRSRRP